MAAARKSFGSDNHAGTHPAVMRAIVAANAADAVAYGADQWTERVTAEIQRRSGARGGVYLVLNGSGANVLGLGLLLGRYQAVICAESAHINTDECGAAEKLLGTKLLTVAAPDGKLTPELIETRLAGRGDEHFAQPGVVAVTQSTEFGTCYSLAELRAIKDFCAANELRVYLDGARLGNATAHLGCSLADLAATADVLSFGGTKNGGMGVEAVIVMDEPTATSAPYLRKQYLQLSSKMRFLAAQFDALLDDDLWLANASHANAMATRLAAGLAEIPGVDVVYPVQADAVFARLDRSHIAALQRDWIFSVWNESTSVVRWMTAFDTQEDDVDAFLADIAATCRLGAGLATPLSRTGTSLFHVKQCSPDYPGAMFHVKPGSRNARNLALIAVKLEGRPRLACQATAVVAARPAPTQEKQWRSNGEVSARVSEH